MFCHRMDNAGYFSLVLEQDNLNANEISISASANELQYLTVHSVSYIVFLLSLRLIEYWNGVNAIYTRNC